MRKADQFVSDTQDRAALHSPSRSVLSLLSQESGNKATTEHSNTCREQTWEVKRDCLQTHSKQATSRQYLLNCVDDQSSFRKGKMPIPHLPQKEDFILKENSHLYCSTSHLSLQIQLRNTSVAYCFVWSYTGPHRTEGTTLKFAQLPFRHLQDLALASESLPRYCNLPTEVSSAPHSRQVWSNTRFFQPLAGKQFL